MRRLQDMIMDFATSVMPKTQADWGSAMRAEYSQITDKKERLKFALGCLQVSLMAAAQTRKGLSLIGRGLVGFGLASFSFYGLLLIGDQIPKSQLTPLLMALCFYYAGAAACTVLSLKGLRLYTGFGLAAAVIVWGALKLTQFETADQCSPYRGGDISLAD